MTADSQHLHGLVDMGSNGIRFSITNLSPQTERLLPTLYQDRAGISLYDAQYQHGNPERQPIPDSIINDVISHFLRFKSVCIDFGVPDSNIAVLATEATRTAINSSAFLAQIKDATGWSVTLLSKEDEGRVGALGVRSSLGSVDGLVMDLGGGSTQLTWLSTASTVSTPPSGAVSMPYGAAALTRRLSEAQSAGSQAVADLASEIRTAISQAYTTLAPPHDFDTLYLSGGGFRGWGFILLSQHPVQPYPISTINGFSAPREAFLDTAGVRTASASTSIHRVSARRAAQVPAVAFLVEQLASVIGGVKRVHFCQGGVREGWLFDGLPDETRALHPLAVAAGNASPEIEALLSAALLPHSRTRPVFGQHIITALAATLNLHASVTTDSRAQTALRYSTTGSLAGVHGLSHSDRAIMGVLLAERHGGRKALPDHERGFYDALAGLLTAEEQWWVVYLGRLAAIIGTLYPCPTPSTERVRMQVRLDQTHDTPTLYLGIHKAWAETATEEVERLEKLGKKKHWPAGWGLKLRVSMTTF